MMIAEGKKLEFLVDGGEMGERIGSFNWENTILGDCSKWSPSLKATVAMMLRNRFPMLLWWGEEYVCIYNDAYIPVLGSKHPWALGKPVKECWSEIWDVLQPLIDQPFFHGKPSWSEDLLLQINRNFFKEETHFTIAYSPAPDPTTGSGIGGVLAIVNEITSQVINERALDTLRKISSRCIGAQTEQEVYVSAAAAIGENNRDFPFAIIYKIDEQGKYARVQATAGIDQSLPEPLSLDVIELSDADSNGINLSRVVEENSATCVATGDSWQDLPKGAWDIMPHHYVHVPIKSPNKKFPLAILTAGLNPYRKFDSGYKDFLQLIADQVSQGVHNALAYEAERRRAEVMEELDKAKTLFFTNISHEFRTPITLLLGNIEEALRDSETAPKNLERLEVANRNAMRLLKLVNMLLDFSRIESGRQDANYVFTDMAAFTKNLAGNFQSLVEKAGLAFIVDADTVEQPVYLDRQMWEKIVFNLLSNAFKYTLKGQIRVTLSATSEHAILKVSDTGVGIPEKELPFMFERFHRVQNTSGRTYEGTGIGLSLIKELVQLHGGNISVESKEGRGSTFTVAIPFGKRHLPESKVKEQDDVYEHVVANAFIDEAQSLLLQPAYADKDEKQKECSETVLIVDDNADMRQHLHSLLHNHYNTVVAVNGMDALQKMQSEHPSLILSDVMMPVMDGMQLVKELKSNADTMHIPVILLTARAGQESRIEGLDIGADDYLVKPFSSLELLSRVKAQLQLKRKQQEAIQKIEQGKRELQQLFKQAPVTIVVYRGENFIVEVANSFALEMWGKTEEEVLGKPFFAVAPELKAAQGLLLKNIMTTGIPFEGKETFVQYTKNGKPYSGYFDFVYQPLRDDQDAIAGVVSIGKEVTHSVEARRRIEESEETLRLAISARTNELLHQKEFVEHILNNAHEWIAVYNKDLQLTMINEASANALGKTREELIGKTLFEISPAAKGSMQEADLRRALRGEEIKNDPFFSQVTGRWIQNYITPLKDERGETYAALAIAQDLTEILTTQAELRKSQQHFLLLFNMSPVAKSISHVLDGTVMDVNPAWEKLFKRKREDVVGKNADQIGLSRKEERTYHAQRVEANGGALHGFEQLFDLGNGKVICTHTSVVAIDLDGVPCYLAGYFDITERKNAEEQIIESARQLAQKNEELERINQELESFNYVASHDLQEPLRKIQMFISLIERKSVSKEEQETYLKKVTAASKRMATLIQAVLAYSRVSKSEEEFDDVDLNTILEDVKTDFELLIQEKQATIYNSPLPVIKASPLQMHQLFSNLISNSLKFAKEAPNIHIQAQLVTSEQMDVQWERQCDRYVHLRFTDNGIGFEPAHKEQIFSLFQRLHARDEFSGTGIGLSIVKKIVEHHQGFVSAVSTPGEGATFHVWLPVC